MGSAFVIFVDESIQARGWQQVLILWLSTALEDTHDES